MAERKYLPQEDFLLYRKILPIKQKNFMSRRTASKLTSVMDYPKTFRRRQRRSRFLVSDLLMGEIALLSKAFIC